MKTLKRAGGTRGAEQGRPRNDKFEPCNDREPILDLRHGFDGPGWPGVDDDRLRYDAALDKARARGATFACCFTHDRYGLLLRQTISRQEDGQRRNL